MFYGLYSVYNHQWAHAMPACPMTLFFVETSDQDLVLYPAQKKRKKNPCIIVGVIFSSHLYQENKSYVKCFSYGKSSL